MAKEKMLVLSAAAPLAVKDELLFYLQKQGAVEVSPQEAEAPLKPPDPDAAPASLDEQRQTAANALAVLEKRRPEKKPLTAMLEPRVTLTDEAFAEKQAEEAATLEACRELLALEREYGELAADTVRRRTLIDQTEPWIEADVPLLDGHTARTAYFIGSFPGDKDREALLSLLAQALPETECVETRTLFRQPEATGAVVYCLREEADAVNRALGSLGFQRAPDCQDEIPRDYIAEHRAAIERNEARLARIDERFSELAEDRRKIEFLLDDLALRRDRAAAGEKLPQTGRVFSLEGYVPERKAARIAETLAKRFDAAAEVLEPPADADAPVLLRNNGFAAPLQNIVGQYSLPGRDDIDPTGPMAFFYYFFFGMMLSDAGYGLLIALATGAVWLKRGKTLEKNMLNNVKMFFFCGLSTLFWGAMYGSWFGDAPSVICREFLHMGEGFNPLPPLWTDAVTDTMNVLIMCFILGLAHLFWGVCMKGLNDLKHGRPLDALCDTVPTFLTVIGIAPVFFGLFVQDQIPADYPPLATFFYRTFMAVHGALNGVWQYILLTGIALVVLTAGRSAKNIAGRLGGGLYGVYNLFSGYLGDVLSYARLLALGMATGVIGQVMNLLGTMPKNPVIKAVSFILVFAVGHAANLAINMIGAYVHTNRLQYVEFFSKFYEGGGRPFEPLFVNTTYYKFKEEQ